MWITFSEYHLDSSPIRYHRLCTNDPILLCFRDDVYLCICVDNDTRVECFIYDHELDRCSSCLIGGRCLRGDRSRSSDFVCLCPPCHSGGQCQFSSKSFTFTLDQLFYTDLVSIDHQQRTMSLLILFSLLGFLFAIPNNVFSFVTFRRSPCLLTGVGHYLLCLSVINQINLGLFFARLTHLAISITSTSAASNLNNVLCKLLNYFLLSSGRMVFWLSSLIAIERLYMTLVLNGRWLKQPHIAHRLIALTIIAVLLTTLYELFFYKSLFIADISQRSMCVFEFPMSYRYQWTTFHLLISTLNAVVPILINLCSTGIISVVVVRKRMNTLRTKKSQFSIEKEFVIYSKICLFLEVQDNQSALVNLRQRIHFILSVLNEKKELVIGPGTTLIPQLFSLPLFISSFTLDCRKHRKQLASLSSDRFLLGIIHTPIDQFLLICLSFIILFG